MSLTVAIQRVVYVELTKPQNSILKLTLLPYEKKKNIL